MIPVPMAYGVDEDVAVLGPDDISLRLAEAGLC